MKRNRFLGVSSDLPTESTHVTYEEARHGSFADFLRLDLPMIEGPLVKHAFPGGYSLVYFFADGEEICADCANTLIQQRADDIGTDRVSWDTEFWEGYAKQTIYNASEILAGYQSMDTTDSCVLCVECHQYVLASGCRAADETPSLYITDKTENPVHSSYCSWYPQCGAGVHPEALSVLAGIFRDGTDDPSADAFEHEGNAP